MEEEIFKEVLPLVLEDGTTVYAQVSILGGVEEVSSIEHHFAKILNIIERLGTSLSTSLRKIKPTKASIEFGIELGLKEGQLVAFLVQGSSKANVKIILEWKEETNRSDK